MVGSCARGHERPLSDVAVLGLTDDPGRSAPSAGCFQQLRPGGRLVRTAAWGPVLVQWCRLRTGLLAEIDMAPVAWAAKPLDACSCRVLRDGHHIVHDPHQTLTRAAAALTIARR